MKQHFLALCISLGINREETDTSQMKNIREVAQATSITLYTYKVEPAEGFTGAIFLWLLLTPIFFIIFGREGWFTFLCELLERKKQMEQFQREMKAKKFSI